MISAAAGSASSPPNRSSAEAARRASVSSTAVGVGTGVLVGDTAGTGVDAGAAGVGVASDAQAVTSRVAIEARMVLSNIGVLPSPLTEVIQAQRGRDQSAPVRAGGQQRDHATDLPLRRGEDHEHVPPSPRIEQGDAAFHLSERWRRSGADPAVGERDLARPQVMVYGRAVGIQPDEDGIDVALLLLLGTKQLS